MNLLASLNDQVGKLVHPAIQASQLEFERHKVFLSSRLAISLAALIIGSLCLAAGAAPAGWESGTLAWLLIPFGAAAYVSRTGDLVSGEALGLIAWGGLALTFAAGSGSGLGLGLLLLIPLETSIGPGSTYSRVALVLTVLIAAGVAAGSAIGLAIEPGAHLGAFGDGIMVAALAYAGMLANLSSRLHRAEQQHDRLEQERYRALVDTIDDVVAHFDRAGALLFASSAADRAFGLKPRDLLGRGFFEHIHVADRPVFLKFVTDAASGADSRTRRLRVRTGKTVPSARGPFEEPVFAWVELRARHSDILDGEPRTAVVALMKNVTARVLHEQGQEDAKQTAARSLAGRDLFLANVSHELRTPLNAIIGFAEMLASTELAPREPAKQREYATIIHQSGQHLLAVVNSILDASKIESGNFDILPEPFDLGELIHLCRDMVSLKAEQAGIDLKSEVTAGLREVVGDKRAYKQIVINLLSNALKFTPKGGHVTIGARLEGNSVLLAVVDTGIGIGPSDLPRLGDPFFQARSNYDRPYDGTGLGLSVVRGLVGLHGGAIAIESAPEEGTCVTVRLPLDCRRLVTAPSAVTKIETIPRYPSAAKPAAGAPDFARVHKIA